MTASASGTAPSIPNVGNMGAIKDEVMTRNALKEPWAVFNPAAIRNDYPLFLIAAKKVRMTCSAETSNNSAPLSIASFKGIGAFTIL